MWARALENDGSSVGSISLLVIFLDVRFFSKKRPSHTDLQVFPTVQDGVLDVVFPKLGLHPNPRSELPRIDRMRLCLVSGGKFAGRVPKDRVTDWRRCIVLRYGWWWSWW